MYALWGSKLEKYIEPGVEPNSNKKKNSQIQELINFCLTTKANRQDIASKSTENGEGSHPEILESKMGTIQNLITNSLTASWYQWRGQNADQCQEDY